MFSVMCVCTIFGNDDKIIQCTSRTSCLGIAPEIEVNLPKLKVQAQWAQTRVSLASYRSLLYFCALFC